ncbi:MAG: DnaJ domain-containing protein [Candidatus Anammoxibacter sp.]
MLYFTAKTLQELRTQYKSLAKKYHPDKNLDVDTTAIMQEINIEYELLFDRVVKHDGFSESRIKYERDLDPLFREKIHLIINIQNILIEVCGSWIWITGDTKPIRETLKKSGFLFSRKKLAWYWHAKGYRKFSSKLWTMQEIRVGYGSEQIQQDEQFLALS